MVNKVNGLLGICTKAGKLSCGTDLVLEEISKKFVKLVIVATDASDKTKKNIKFVCEKNNIELFEYGTIDDNSKAIGKHNKAIIAIKDHSLAKAIKDRINGGELNG